MAWRRALGALGVVAVMGAAYWLGESNAQKALVTSEEINTVEVSRSALPAVVRINNKLRPEVLQQGDDPLEVGTGFFYTKDLIITNYHVIQDAESLTVVLGNGKYAPARVVGRDPGIDIAVLKVTGVTAPKTLSFGQSSRLVAGQKLIVLGTPLRIPQFISTGIFSVMAHSRDIPRNDGLGSEIGQYILTTASIQGGNSGGPVLDSRGAVVAVADANASQNQLAQALIGVAIPSDLVKQSVDDLIKVGAPQRGTLGVTLHDLDNLDPALRSLAGLSSSSGALIWDVPAGSAGARAGLRGSIRNSKDQLVAPLGDIIVAVDGVPVATSFDVARLVAAKRPGDKVKLQLWRNKRSLSVTVTILKRTLEWQ